MSNSLWDEQEISVSLRAFVLREPNACPEEILSAVEADDVVAVKKRAALFPAAKLNKLLLYASWKGSLATVEAMLERHANPNAADSAGRTCLHLSAINGRLVSC